MRVNTLSCVLLLLALEAVSLDSHTIDSIDVAKSRPKRGAIWDFFQKVFVTKNLVVDQYVDTRNTLNEVYNMVNEGFSDPAPRKPTLPSSSTSTTAAPDDDESGDSSSGEVATSTEYLISRYELGRILGRNFRGLQRLLKIELNDAFNQSQYNIAEYRQEARQQFANSLAVEKKNQLHNLKG